MLIRIEKKVDEVMRRQDNDKAPRQMLHHTGQACPLCHSAVKYQPVQIAGGEIIIRECRCEPTATELPKGEVK
jgi:hypothetical protein